MKLKKQLQTLIDEAPDHGIPAMVMERAVNPVLTILAKQLKHPKYYILHNREGNWLLHTISHTESPEKEKTVIYAFSTPQDALRFQGLLESNLQTSVIPVTHLLFQVYALKQIESIIFMDTPGNIDQGIEITCEQIRLGISIQLKQFRSSIA